MSIRNYLLVFGLSLAAACASVPSDDVGSDGLADGIEQELVQTKQGLMVQTTVDGKTTLKSCNPLNCWQKCTCKKVTCVESGIDVEICDARQEACVNNCALGD